MVLTLDIRYAIRVAAEQLVDRSIKIRAFADIQSLFIAAAQDKTTAKRRNQIDIMTLKERYRRKELHKIVWLSGAGNIGDVLTKKMISLNESDVEVSNGKQIRYADCWRGNWNKSLEVMDVKLPGRGKKMKFVDRGTK